MIRAHHEQVLVPCWGLRLQQLIEIMSARLHKPYPTWVVIIPMICAKYEQVMVP